MTSYEVVTTFSPEGYRVYGKQFLRSYLANWNVPITVYYETGQEIDLYHGLLTWKCLDHDEDRRRFMEHCLANPATIGTARDPNSQSIRFCHKVFALTGHKHTADWMFWLDADVVCVRPVDALVLPRFAPEGAFLTFLGRPHATYTECGFVGYRTEKASVQRLLADMRTYYTSLEIFTRPKSDWHDSRCFDVCRERSEIAVDRQVSLVERQTKDWHVWPVSALAPYLVHNKGPGRKKRAYGKVCE